LKTSHVLTKIPRTNERVQDHARPISFILSFRLAKT
jgi:hypothetical protein